MIYSSTSLVSSAWIQYGTWPLLVRGHPAEVFPSTFPQLYNPHSFIGKKETISLRTEMHLKQLFKSTLIVVLSWNLILSLMKSDPGKGLDSLDVGRQPSAEWEEREGAGLSQVVRQLTTQHSRLCPFQHSLSVSLSIISMCVLLIMKTVKLTKCLLFCRILLPWIFQVPSSKECRNRIKDWFYSQFSGYEWKRSRIFYLFSGWFVLNYALTTSH